MKRMLALGLAVLACLALCPGVLAQSAAPAVNGNLIPDGSFETGIGHGWGPGEGSRDRGSKAYWDPTTARTGLASLKLEPWDKLISRQISVLPNRPYTLSFWARADGVPGTSQTLFANVQSAYNGTNVLLTGVPVASKLVVLQGSAWQQVQLTTTISNISTSPSQLHVIIYPTSTRTWIDDLQLEEGEVATPFQTQAPLELGLTIDTPGHVLFDDESLSGTLRVYNGTRQPLARDVRCEIYDTQNRKVKEETIPVSIAPGATFQSQLNLSSGRRGAFRAVLWADGIDGSDEEVVFSIVPRPRFANPDASSMIGIHAETSTFQYEILKRLGVKWTRMFSPAGLFRWEKVEIIPGKIDWFDADIIKTVNSGIDILGNIVGDSWPTWADQGGRPNLDHFENFIYRTVDHYKPWIKHWEVCNEPNQKAYGAAFYAEMAKRAYSAIRRADPQARIVGIGGSASPLWAVSALNGMGGSPIPYMDVVSTHQYPGTETILNGTSMGGRDPKAFTDQIGSRFGVPIWNTESGSWCLGFYQGANANHRTIGGAAYRYQLAAITRPGFVAKSFLDSIGSGLSKYFYYDARFITAGNYYRTHSTVLEYDDSVRPKGVALAILGYFFDHSIGLGDVSPDALSSAYLFDREGTPLAGLFTRRMLDSKSVTLALSRFKFNAYDMWGNVLPISGTTVPFGANPVYIEGINGLTVAELRSALENGFYTQVADTIAPRISISEGPRGSVSPGSFSFRWIAFDNLSVNMDPVLTRDAILYSYRLGDGSSAWSTWDPSSTLTTTLSTPGSYRFEVRARDEAGNISAAASRDFVVSNIPSRFGAKAVSGTQVDIAWIDNSDNETGFQIERKEGVSGTYQPIALTGPNVVSWSDSSGLQPGRQYFYRVIAALPTSGSDYSKEAVIITPGDAAAPSGLVAVAAAMNAVDLTWVDNSVNETGFEVERKVDTVGAVYQKIGTTLPGASTFRDGNVSLTPNSSRTYRVRALSAAGGIPSPYSNEFLLVSPTGLVAPYSLTSTVISSNQINLLWTDNSTNETGFEIERKSDFTSSYAVIATVGAGVRVYESQGLLPGTRYWFRVRTMNGTQRSLYSNETSPTTQALPTVPLVPSNFRAAAASLSQINLTWTDVSTNETGFQIERKTTYGGTYAPLASVAAGVQSLNDSGLLPNTTYFYRIQAFNAAGNSAFFEASATTLNLTGAPAAPSALTAVAVSGSRVDLTWTDNSADETGFRIERKEGYLGTYSTITTVPAGQRTYSDVAGLSQNSQYYYRTRALNLIAESSPSNEANTTTLGPPAAPSGLRVINITTNQATLVWFDNSNNETAFRLEHKRGTGDYIFLFTCNPNTTSFLRQGLVPGTQYTFRVNASNTFGISPWANEVTITTPLIPTAPAAPSSLVANVSGPDTIALSWVDNSNSELVFKIESRAGASGTFQEVGMVATGGTNFSLSGLVPGIQYFFRVRAANGTADSSYSNEADALISTAPPVGPTAPSRLIATAISENRIDLAWLDNSNNEIGFRIQRKEGAAGLYTTVATLGAGAVTYSDTAGLVPNTAYAYRILAMGSVVDSDYSNEATATTLNPPTTLRLDALGGGYRHALAVKAGGTVWAWGQNAFGQLGNGTTVASWLPLQIPGLSNVVAVSHRGLYHSMALRGDGTLWTWGLNSNRQLGNGTSTIQTTPRQVVALGGNVARIGGGADHTMAVLNDGSFWIWGDNSRGQLGLGPVPDQAAPVQVPLPTTVVDATGGDYHTLVALSDGSVWTWGYNLFGALGLGYTNEFVNVPTQVAGLNNVVAVAGGRNHSLALKSDGSVWAWGGNSIYQLGDNTTVQRTLPVLVGLTGVVAISAGDTFSMALKSDGSVWTWGWGAYGQLGGGSTVPNRVPGLVTGVSGIVGIATGWFAAYALHADGRVWSWGENSSGQLGNGTNVLSTVPVPLTLNLSTAP